MGRTTALVRTGLLICLLCNGRSVHTADRGSDFELAIVGDGAMRGRIERPIDQFSLRGRARITGYLST